MKIEITEQNSVAIVVVEGNILRENVSLLSVRLWELVETGRCRIVLDIMRSNYISSMGLALIVDIKNRVEKLHGDIKLAGVNHLIKNLLEITNLTKKIEIYGANDEALKAFE
jgi:anti-anti-sigma factor